MAMWRARVEENWVRTASVIAVIAEVNRDPELRKKPFTAAEFNPFTRRVQKPPEIELHGEELDRVMTSIFNDNPAYRRRN